MSQARKVVIRRLSGLKEHPRQRELFGDVTDRELEALAADMDENGLQHPVEILRDGTIIAGHQRVRAAKLLGWKSIDVVIRRDLEDAGGEVVEAYVIRDNMVRRHLTPLGKARCIKSLLKLESCWLDNEKLKEKVGEQLGMTARNVNRYLRVLEAPREVQDAFDCGDVTLINAGKVSMLGRQEQQDIAQRISDGEDAKEVVDEYLSQGSYADDPERAARRLFRSLAAEVPRLKAGPDRIHAGFLRNYAPVLRAASELFAELVSSVDTE